MWSSSALVTAQAGGRGCTLGRETRMAWEGLFILKKVWRSQSKLRAVGKSKMWDAKDGKDVRQQKSTTGEVTNGKTMGSLKGKAGETL